MLYHVYKVVMDLMFFVGVFFIMFCFLGGCFRICKPKQVEDEFVLLVSREDEMYEIFLQKHFLLQV